MCMCMRERQTYRDRQRDIGRATLRGKVGETQRKTASDSERDEERREGDNREKWEEKSRAQTDR